MSFLSTDLLAQIHSRASAVDAANQFPHEDFKALKESGYYSAFVPAEYGGAGLSLEQIAEEQTQLAKASPATALAINMHQIIVGVGRHMVRSGNPAGEQILREAVDGELFAFGISEPGNDLVLFGSISTATPTETGYAFTGTKIFTSMAPAWSRLMTFGKDSQTGKSVFGILKRDGGGVEVKDDWDTLGMRGTQSNTTILDGAETDWILTVTDPGPSTDPVVFGIFANFEILLGATYRGIGERAVEVAVEHVRTRRSVKNQTVYANDPDIRWRIADAAIRMDSVGPQLRELATAFDESIDLGASWMPRLSAVKNAAAEASLHAVDQCIRACGGSSYYTRHELSRLYRDVLAGLFQPSDQESLHSAWASMLLGPVQSS